MFGQTFQPRDLLIVLLLVVLEGVLSIDNALVLGLLAMRLDKHHQGRALTYGLVGAFVFRRRWWVPVAVSVAVVGSRSQQSCNTLYSMRGVRLRAHQLTGVLPLIRWDVE